MAPQSVIGMFAILTCRNMLKQLLILTIPSIQLHWLFLHTLHHAYSCDANECILHRTWTQPVKIANSSSFWYTILMNFELKSLLDDYLLWVRLHIQFQWHNHWPYCVNFFSVSHKVSHLHNTLASVCWVRFVSLICFSNVCSCYSPSLFVIYYKEQSWIVLIALIENWLSAVKCILSRHYTALQHTKALFWWD